MRERRKTPKWSQKYVSGASFTLAALLLIVLGLKSDRPQRANWQDAGCQGTIDTEAAVETQQVKQLPGREGSARAEMRQFLGTPYCTLPKLSVRFGAITERDVYRTPERARLIVAYEEGEYLGYGVEDLKYPGRSPNIEATAARFKEIELQKSWGIHAGDVIGNYPVAGGLGEISLRIRGNIRAPMDGRVEDKFVLVSEGTIINSDDNCVLFSSPQLPAYLSKFCGLETQNLGLVRQGQSIGKTDGYLHVALLTYRQSAENRNQWVYVSPSMGWLEKLVAQN
jgi:hypothetical protein